MNTISKGMVAGFVATVVLSLFMVMKSLLGLMPQLDMIAMLTQGANNYMGLPATPVIGWIIHFFVGTVAYGIAFILLNSVLPGHSPTAKGITLGIIGWLIAMIILMPLMGKAFF